MHYWHGLWLCVLWVAVVISKLTMIDFVLVHGAFIVVFRKTLIDRCHKF